MNPPAEARDESLLLVETTPDRGQELLRDVVIGVAGLLVAGVFLQQTLQLVIFARGQPGEGLYPLILVIAVGALSLWILRPAVVAIVLRSQGGTFRQAATTLPWSGLSKIIKIAVATVLSAILIEPLGFVPVLFLFLVSVLVLIERRRLLIAVPIAAGVTTAFYLLFAVFLGIPFPRSPLGF